MKLRSRCFPLEYYPGEVLTEVEARRRQKHITCYTLIICSLWASNLEVGQSETNGFQTRTEIHRVIHDLRGGVDLTEAAYLLITIWMLNQQSVGFQPVRQAPSYFLTKILSNFLSILSKFHSEYTRQNRPLGGTVLSGIKLKIPCLFSLYLILANLASQLCTYSPSRIKNKSTI